MLYPAKRDWWITGLLLGPGCFLVADSLFLGGLAVRLNWSFSLLIFPALFLAAGMILLAIVFGTSYELTSEELRIRFGPFGRTIHLRSIVEVHSARQLSPAVGWGLALSLDRLLIRYRKANGRMGVGVKISPQDKAEFLRELKANAPGVIVTGDLPS
jgi:hypothetical protein